MRTGIEQARIELEKWEAKVLNDSDALANAEHEANCLRSQLSASTKTTENLRRVVKDWDAMQARNEQKNTTTPSSTTETR